MSTRRERTDGERERHERGVREGLRGNGGGGGGHQLFNFSFSTMTNSTIPVGENFHETINLSQALPEGRIYVITKRLVKIKGKSDVR